MFGLSLPFLGSPSLPFLGSPSIKKTLEALYTNKVNNRVHTSRGTTHKF